MFLKIKIKINGTGSRGTARGERPYDDPICSFLGRATGESSVARIAA